MTWNLRGAILSALPWAVGGRLVGRVVAWAGGLIVLRHVSPTDLGTMAIAALMLETAATLRDLGLSSALVQKAELEDRLLRQTVAITLFVSTLLASAFFIAAPYLAAWFDMAALERVTRLICLPVLAAALGVVPEAMLRRTMQFRLLAVIDVLAIAGGGGTAIVMAVQGFGVWALAAGLVVRTLIRTAMLPVAARRIPLPVFDFRGMGGALGFGSHVTARKILALFTRQVDVLIIGRLLGPAVLGSYNLGMSLSKIVLRLAVQDLNAVAFPALARVQTDFKLVGRYYRRAAETLSLVVVPAAVGLFLLAGDLVPLLFGPQWTEVAVVIRFTSLLLPLYLLARLLPSVLSAIGRPGLATRNSLVTLALFVPAMIAGARFGLEGAAVGYAASQAIAALINLKLALSAWNGRLRDELAAIMPAFACGAIMLAAGIAVHALGNSAVPSLSRLILTGLAASAAYGAATILLNRNSLTKAVALVRR